MISSHLAKLIAGKALYVVVCLFAAVLLVVAGYAHKVVGLVSETEKGIAITGGASAGASVGAMNILVMGLESRTNFQGQCLSAALLTAMHAGNVQSCQDQTVGAQDTDTLILIHIFAGGKKAVGYSIPRDDLVTYPHATYLGITQGKIDQAYDFAYNVSLGQTYGSSDSSNERYLLANRAGQAFEIATVESLTGVHIDHFVETNLDGFYSLASAFGGIEVCVQPWAAGNDANLSDDASGWNAVKDGYNVKKGGDQYLHLAPDQALAYVRDRDSLPEIDLDRTHRQQAVVDYVIWKLKHDGTLGDLGALNSLLGSASQFLITDSTFNLLDFASNMRALTGTNMTFQTLPIASETSMELNGSSQDVNIIDVRYIQQYVQNAFYPQPAGSKSAAATSTPTPAPSTITVDVYNGSNTPGLAANVSQALSALGYKAGAVGNATAQQTVGTDTQVFYGSGASVNARSIASDFGTTAQSLTSLPAGHVEVLLGSSTTSVPAGLSSSSTQSTQSTGAKVIGGQTSAATDSPSTSSSPATTPGANDGQTGGSVTVAPNAPFGVPCVY
ncbi:MAG TPA: LCP family protein [Trebonia sp.]|nr:LCP family protein [Trebonia sp.]